MTSQYRGPMDVGKDRQMPVGLDEITMGNRMRFTVVDGFFSEEFKSEYVAGLSYDTGDNKELEAAVTKWIKEGKVREGGPVATMTGTDEASDKK